MTDEIIEELWEIKDDMAREHDNDVRKLAAYLRSAHPDDTPPPRSIMEILNSGPERRLFQTAEEVKAYLAEEKASWNR